MKSKLESNTTLFEILDVIEEGYRTGDFEKLFPYLTEDVVFESMWVKEPNDGYEATVNYLRGKGQTLKRTGSFPHGYIVELIGNTNPIKKAKVSVNGEIPTEASIGMCYEPGKLCLLLEQELNGEDISLLIDVQITEDGKVKRIDLCMPELFKYRHFYTYVNLVPAKEDDEKEEALVRVSEPYYRELYLFLDCAGLEFDEYDDLTFPINKWIKALEIWKKFVEATSFDQALEDIAGINYEQQFIEQPELARRICDRGQQMWLERKNSSCMVNGLLEWTEKYKDSCDSIKSYGW